jgi:hypothetical protein
MDEVDVSDEAMRYRILAAGARNLVKRISSDNEKKTLIEIAAKYDRLAHQADRGDRLRSVDESVD